MNHPSESQELVAPQATIQELCAKLQDIFGNRVQIVGDKFPNICLDNHLEYSLCFKDGNSWSLTEGGERIVQLARSKGESAVTWEHLAFPELN